MDFPHSLLEMEYIFGKVESEQMKESKRNSKAHGIR